MTALSPTLSAESGPTPSDPGLDRREAFLIDLVREAGRLAQRAFSGAETLAYRMKGPQDFLTATDAAVEELVQNRLQSAFPEDGFLGEESGGVLSPQIWVVDPIDGTANFARRIPHYCVSIAFVSHGVIALGAVFDPAHDELYFARRGRGATRNGKPVRVSDVRDAHAVCVELGWSTRVPNSDYLDALAGILKAGANARRGATGALGLAYVADGRSDGYAELHMQPWDCLAGLLLVEEAGGRVSPYLENGGLAKGGPVLAVAPGAADLMQSATGIALK